MNLKKMVVLLLTVTCLCSAFCTTAFAETNETLAVSDSISPAYDLASSARADLLIENLTAYCTSYAFGDDVVSITVTQTLQKYWGLWIWISVDGAEWSKTVNDSTIILSSTKSGLDSGTYRVMSVFKLTNKNGKTETVTVYSSEKTIA